MLLRVQADGSHAGTQSGAERESAGVCKMKYEKGRFSMAPARFSRPGGGSKGTGIKEERGGQQTRCPRAEGNVCWAAEAKHWGLQGEMIGGRAAALGKWYRIKSGTSRCRAEMPAGAAAPAQQQAARSSSRACSSFSAGQLTPCQAMPHLRKCGVAGGRQKSSNMSARACGGIVPRSGRAHTGHLAGLPRR